VRRIPRGLANYQDLYLVTRGASAKGEEALAGLRGGAEGFLESCHLSAARWVEIRGWVTDRFTRQPVREVWAVLDGLPAPYTAELWERPEIAAVFPGDAASGQGFRVEIPLPAGCQPGSTGLSLVAVGADGFATPLFAGTLLACITRVALYNLLHVSRENEALKRRIEGMRASRFWKIRDRWFAFKRWLGMTA
jgi:hypothetical protein